MFHIAALAFAIFIAIVFLGIAVMVFVAGWPLMRSTVGKMNRFERFVSAVGFLIVLVAGFLFSPIAMMLTFGGTLFMCMGYLAMLERTGQFKERS